MELEMEFIRKLPSPQELKEDYPVEPAIYETKRRRDEEIKDILTGKDSRFLLIIGPCSADNEEAVVDYAHTWPACRNRSRTRFISFPAYIPINRVPSG